MNTGGLIAVGTFVLPKLLGDAFWPVIGILLVVEVLVVSGCRVRTERPIDDRPPPRPN